MTGNISIKLRGPASLCCTGRPLTLENWGPSDGPAGKHDLVVRAQNEPLQSKGTRLWKGRARPHTPPTPQHLTCFGGPKGHNRGKLGWFGTQLRSTLRKTC